MRVWKICVRPYIGREGGENGDSLHKRLWLFCIKHCFHMNIVSGKEINGKSSGLYEVECIQFGD